MVKQDPKQTIEFLLGQIASDVSTIKEKQEKIDKKIDEGTLSLEKKINAIQLEVDEIKKDNAFNKGFIAAIAAVGASLGVGITYLGKFILSAVN